MALLSDYTAGTVTVSAGGTAVTGSGTAWLTAGFREGDEFFAAGWHGIVQSVNSNTSLTLYPIGIRGAALSGAAYRLRFQGDNSRVTAQARQLIELLGGTGNFEAFAGLTGAANRFPIFTGAGTMDLATVTAFFRGLMDETTGADVYAGLGTIPNGQLPDRLKANALAVSDLNSITDSGFYRIAGTEGGNPVGASGVVLHIQYDSSAALQVFWRGGASPQRLSRWKWGGTWTSWDYSSDRLVGTVSQSSGQPTGAIIERGSNANGEYVRFADGTQICTKTVGGFGPIDTTHGSSFISSVISLGDWPATFSAKPVRSVTAQGATQASVIYGNTAPSASGIGQITLVRFSSSAGTNFEVGVMGIGRWF